MEYMTTREAAERWGLTTWRVQLLCGQDKIPGVAHLGKVWTIPNEAVKPKDRRFKRVKEERK